MTTAMVMLSKFWVFSSSSNELHKVLGVLIPKSMHGFLPNFQVMFN